MSDPLILDRLLLRCQTMNEVDIEAEDLDRPLTESERCNMFFHDADEDLEECLKRLLALGVPEGEAVDIISDAFHAACNEHGS